ncbi:unnamed protein product [Linum grandiflorum]
MGASFCLAQLVSMAVLVLLQLVIQSHGASHKVGDSVGWTILGSPDYKQWASTKSFQLGDIVHFEYNPQFHNVMKVTHAMYRACNASAPLQTYTTGNDSITITTRGHHYFICGVVGHCQSGQKVDINVLRITDPSAAAPALAVSPTLPSVHSPAPSATSASSSSFFFTPPMAILLLAGQFLFHVGFSA